MKRHWKHRTRPFLCIGIALLGLGFATAVVAEDAKDKEQLYENLREIEIAVAEIENRAAELHRSPFDQGINLWKSHSYETRQIDSEINRIGALIPKIQNNPAAKPWQKEIVDDISGLIKGMAAHATKINEYLGDRPAEVELDDRRYQARLAGLMMISSQVDTMIDYVDERVDLPEILIE